MNINTNNELFGIVTRRNYVHGRRVLESVRRGDLLRARWYSNYAICRFAHNKLAAVYARGGFSERHRFDEIILGRGSLDILLQRRLRRLTRLHR
jgi:hypothetical protein